MRTTGVVTINKVGMYGLVVESDAGVRLRVLAAEWAALGVDAGQTVTVGLPARPPARLLVTAVVPGSVAGTVWVHLASPVDG